MTTLAWHYTAGCNYIEILKSGLLRPATLYISKNEHPIIWFSLEQYWEPTAQKAIELPNGAIQLLGMLGTYREGAGLFRFGTPSANLVLWPRLAKLAEIPASHRRGLERVAQEQGAIPERWCGVIGKPLPLSEVATIEAFDGSKWNPVG